MTGGVDQADRALLTISVTDVATARTAVWDAWIDTAFNGELVVPRELLDKEGFKFIMHSNAVLADGSRVIIDLYEGEIDWFGVRKKVEIVASDGQLPLLGVTLLKGHKLTIDYGSGAVSLE